MNAQNWISIVAILSAVIAYFSKNFIFQPFIQYKKVVGRTRNRLKYYANVFGNDVKQKLQNEARKEVRQLSCDLEEAYYAIGWYKFLVWLHLLPLPSSIETAARDLIGLSNSTGARVDFEKLNEQQEEIKRELNMPGYKNAKDD
jgi:hypothetical protein